MTHGVVMKTDKVTTCCPYRLGRYHLQQSEASKWSQLSMMTAYLGGSPGSDSVQRPGKSKAAIIFPPDCWISSMFVTVPEKTKPWYVKPRGLASLTLSPSSNVLRTCSPSLPSLQTIPSRYRESLSASIFEKRHYCRNGVCHLSISGIPSEFPPRRIG